MRGCRDGQRLALSRGFQRGEIVELPPLHGRFAPAVAASATFAIARTIGRSSPLLPPSIPYDLHTGIVAEGTGEQLEGGKVATPYDDESRIVHRIPAS